MKIDIILEPDQTPAQIAELGRLAESYGINTLWATNYASARDAFMSMVPMAQATSRIGVGVLVVSPWEMHPLKMANSLMTLNEFANGRAQMVISAGGEWCGVMGASPARRVRAARETAEIMKAAFSGEPVNFDGALYKVRGYRPNWPVGAPPRIYIGASKPQMIRMARGVADGLMMSDVVPETVAQGVAVMRQAETENKCSGEPFPVSNFWAWHVKKDRAVSFHEARREMILRGWLVKFHLSPFLSDEDCALVEKHKNAFLKAYQDRSGDIEGVPQRIIDQLIDCITFSGSDDDIERHAESLRRFEAAGLTEIALRLHDNQAESLRMIGERLLPAAFAAR